MEQPEGARLGFFAARHGYRPEQRRVGGSGKRASGQLRPAQVQGHTEWSEGDGTTLPGRMDALSDAGAELPQREGFGQRRLALLHVGRSVRHAWLGEEHAYYYRQLVRFSGRTGQREVGDSARAVSDGILRQRDGRTL